MNERDRELSIILIAHSTNLAFFAARSIDSPGSLSKSYNSKTAFVSELSLYKRTAFQLLEDSSKNLTACAWPPSCIVEFPVETLMLFLSLCLQ